MARTKIESATHGFNPEKSTKALITFGAGVSLALALAGCAPQNNAESPKPTTTHSTEVSPTPTDTSNLDHVQGLTAEQTQAVISACGIFFSGDPNAEQAFGELMPADAKGVYNSVTSGSGGPDCLTVQLVIQAQEEADRANN
jgi:hypothetical protein